MSKNRKFWILSENDKNMLKLDRKKLCSYRTLCMLPLDCLILAYQLIHYAQKAQVYICVYLNNILKFDEKSQYFGDFLLKYSNYAVRITYQES